MHFIYIDKLSFSYANQTIPLFDSISFQLQSGWTGIVGPNGSGKTTLLKLLTNTIKPDYGSISFQGMSYYCEQRTDDIPEGSVDFAESSESDTFKLKNKLQIQDDWFDRWDSLSHGERKRCQIAIALYQNPGLLGIDEPTNHLDKASRSILINSLSNYPGIGVIVSHDRELLDQLCSHTLILNESGIKLFKCNYSTAMEEQNRINEALQNERDLVQREIKKMKRKITGQREKTDQAHKLKSKRNINRKDHDAKAKKDLARLTGKDAVAGQIYKQMQNRLARTEQVRDSIHVTKSFELGIQFNPQIYNRYFPIILKPYRITMGANRFLRFSELTVQNGNKIGLIGNNGSGKSTFINYFFKQLKIEKDKVIYIPQEIPAAQAKAIIDDVRNFNDIEKGQVMTLIRRLGSNPVHVLETEIPSPGEVRKLLLAQGLMRNPAIIIMDEPTNHMDLPSIECLESALTECGCTQILVSHDHIFLSQIVDHYWKFEPDDSGGFKINTRY